MKEKIENFFQNTKKATTFKDILKKLNLQNEDIKEVIDTLYQLECEGKIFKCVDDSYIHVPSEFYLKFGEVKRSTKGNLYVNLEHGEIALIPLSMEKYIKEGNFIFFEIIKNAKYQHQYTAVVKRVVDKLKVTNNYLITGKLAKDYNKNYFYIKLNQNDRVYIPNEYLNGAFVNDEVTVRVINEDDEFIGRIEHIIKRNRNEHLFICKKLHDKLILSPIGTYSLNIKDVPDGVVEGDCVLFDISNTKEPKFIEVIKDIENNVYLYAAEYGFDISFNDKTILESNEINEVINETEINKRRDLRNLKTFTIDSETAKDLDDAVSLEVYPDKYILYVSIADVSYYVKPGSELFKTACERTTSIYPANSVIPMLPKKLSDGVCSLNPNEDKLAKTVEIIFDKEGNILDYQIYNSIINSNKKMTYKKVNDILEGRMLHPDYLPYYDILREMNKLSNLLQDRRMNRGFICFEDVEYEYVLDNNGDIVDVTTRERGPAQILIENFMLIANEMVAGFISGLSINGAFRCHEAPSIDQVRKLKNNIYNINKYVHIFNNISDPKLLQKVLLTIFKGKTEEEIRFISKIMLRSMNRAYYSTNNIGHYGLALSEYLTFTSPIRRLPDLLNHLIIGYILDGDLERLELIVKNYEELCEHASQKQMDADILEKNINYMLMNKFLSEFSGIPLEAKVKFIIKDFIYIKTINGICGIIHLGKNNYNGIAARIKQDEIHVGDLVNVMFEYVQDYTDDIVFTYAGKIKNVERVRKS